MEYVIGFCIACLLIVIISVVRKDGTPASGNTVPSHGQAKKVTKSTNIFPCVKHVGVNTPDNTRDEIAQWLKIGDRLVLVPDKDNSVDPNSVKVYTLKGKFIGHIEKKMSAFVCQNISHASSCKVHKISMEEESFVDALINFSLYESKQPDFITDENKDPWVETEPVSKDISSFPCVKYVAVKGIYYRKPEEIYAAQSLSPGDPLILVLEPGNPVDRNAVKVCTREGFHIGYVEADMSDFVRRNLSHVSSCKVKKVSKHEIPFIDATIHFTKEKHEQPGFIPVNLQVTPADRLRDMRFNIKRDYRYRRVPLSVVGTFEEPREAIAKARALKEGDKVILKKAEYSEIFPYRLDVYTEDGTMIGFACGINSHEVYELFDKIHTVLVESSLDTYSHQSLFLYVFFPDDLKWVSTYPSEDIIGFVGPYPQLRLADSIKRTDTAKALEMALPIADKEKGIDAKFLCCQCYRLLKDYKLERDMILRILDRIDTIAPDDISNNEYRILKNRASEIMKRLDTVESRLNSKSKKKNNQGIA